MKYFPTLLLLAPLMAQQYDLVLANGRVMDPESGLYAVRYVGITGTRIAAVSATGIESASVSAKRCGVVQPLPTLLHAPSPDAGYQGIP